MTYRIGFLTSHPIQYQVPVFRHLAVDPALDFTVFFCQIPDARMQGAEFNVSFTWDIPLLGGYEHRVLKNVSQRPSVMDYHGCDTPEIAEILAHGNYDALVINGWVVKSCLQGLRACRRLRIPCLVRGEANDLRPRAFWKRWLQRQLVHQYAGCLAIGKANAEFYRRRGVPEARLFSAPYCIDNERFAAADDPQRRREARRRWDIAEDAVCFLSSGKLIHKKHPLELIGAYRACDVRNPVHLLIVGDGPLREACAALAAESPLPITFAGFLNQGEILDAYAAADCLVLPSDAGETWGLVVNEAMAAGRPAIVSDLVGCAADLVTPRETGLVFPFGDWQALAARLAEAASDRERLRCWGLSAMDRIRHYSPRVAATGISRAVESLLRKPARSSRT
jgi:glycosyltransferase involved in cell wall biosynthesis